MSNHDHLEIAYKSIELFANDGTLNEAEFNQLLDIALRDGEVNDEEKRVLSNILNRLKGYEIDESFAKRIAEAKAKYGLE